MAAALLSPTDFVSWFMICQFACNHLCPCCSFIYDSLFSCKDRALERDRPHQRKKILSPTDCRWSLDSPLVRENTQDRRPAERQRARTKKNYRPPCSPSCSSPCSPLPSSLLSFLLLLALLLCSPLPSSLLSFLLLLALARVVRLQEEHLPLCSCP